MRLETGWLGNTWFGNMWFENGCDGKARIAIAVAMLAFAPVALSACGDDGGGAGVDSGLPDGSPDGAADGDVDGGDPDGGTDAGGPVAVLPGASRGTTIDSSPDDSLVAMVNPADGSLSIFSTADNTRLSRTATGAGPSAVVIHPDGVTAFVSNQRDSTVVSVTGIDTASPTVGSPVDVGSSPTGLALSPTGARLFVAEWAEGRVSVIETASMTVVDSLEITSPYTVAVTNDGDEDDDDEVLIVPEFFGRATAEMDNTGREGVVHLRSLADLTSGEAMRLAPIDSGFGAAGDTDMTAPNQLAGVAIAGGRLFLPSISASPAAPVAFNRNVHPVVYVGDLSTGAEDTSATGSANLAGLVRDNLDGSSARHFLADIVALDFVGDDIAYVVSRGSDVLQRLDYSGGSIGFGSPMADQIDVGPAPAGATAGCQNPTGITIVGATAYLNCWVSRNLGVVDLASQALLTTVESTSPPSGAEAVARHRGLRFFHTGRARWSSESWSDCASCHPGGLTDNITWAFPAGPRQTTSLDGAFSHGDGDQVQRVFNWTGIFDELHDFERNTRGVSGGLGAVTVATDGSDCGAGETAADISGALPAGNPIEEIQDAGCTTDWDDVEAWVRTVQPPPGRRALDADSVARGAALFGAGEGNCTQCHGGAGWTASRRYWSPSTANNAALAGAAFTPPAAWPAGWNTHSSQIQPQPAGLDPDDAATEVLIPPHVACVLRDIGTFGARTTSGIDLPATATIEQRANGARAQGAGGYNIPSLYGLSLGAPYLHHGQAATLSELLDPRGPWRAHVQAGSAVFLEGDDGSSRRDLVNFLLSIDASTAEQDVPAGFDGCPTTFP